MALKERERAILDFLQREGEGTVEALCRHLFVSEPTVRRDLAALNERGLLIRTHGGARRRDAVGQNLPQEVRERENAAAKEIIGRKCLELVKDGDTVMADGSSTALALIRLLGERKNILLVTNSAKAPLVLANTGVKVFVTGGEVAPNAYAYVGSTAEESFRRFRGDVCFFSVRTLTESGELTDNALAENDTRRVMLSRCQRRVLMLDSGKIGEACSGTLCTLAEVTDAVSERDLSPLFPAYREIFR